MLIAFVALDFVEVVAEVDQVDGKSFNGCGLVGLALLLGVVPDRLALPDIFGELLALVVDGVVLEHGLLLLFFDLDEWMRTCCLSWVSYSVALATCLRRSLILALIYAWLRCLWPWVKQNLRVRDSINLIIIQIKIWPFPNTQ